jgi:hypothetical protein
MSKERGLLAYLGDISGEEYDWLGHFREHEWLCEGHNELQMETQIEEGNIPSLHGPSGGGHAANSEVGNVGETGSHAPGTEGQYSGQKGGQAPDMSHPSAQKAKGGGPISQAIKGTIGDVLGGRAATDFSGGEGAPGTPNDEEASTNLAETFKQNLPE